MKDKLFTMSEDVQVLISAVLIATLGGIVNWIRHPRKNRWTFAAAILTAAFTGMMSHFLTGWMNLDVHLQYAVSGAAGYSGGVLPDTMVPVLMEMVKGKMEGKKEK